jgi:hypothetical protein
VQAVFAVARGELVARSLAGRAEVAFAGGDVRAAAQVLADAPGALWRAADRVLRNAAAGESGAVLGCFASTAAQVSGRVLLSVREHLQNRQARAGVPRVFVNRRGRAWVTSMPGRRSTAASWRRCWRSSMLRCRGVCRTRVV